MNKFNESKNFIITGGLGFIGGCLIRKLLNETKLNVFNIDKDGYASDSFLLNEYIKKNNFQSRYKLFKVDLSDKYALGEVFKDTDPCFVSHLAAESHVDRSIDKPFDFIKSNILGTFNLLDESLKHWKNLDPVRKNNFRLHHVSTDEVFGSLNDDEKSFDEFSPYDPRSPYSASKASSDFLVRSWFHTYNLPIIVTNCSNNFGPRQFPEKLIPLVIQKILKKESIPLYGDGSNVRDWLYVEDHTEALMLAINNGTVGETYCIGGHGELTNIEIVNLICEILDKKIPQKAFSYKSLIKQVDDRPGHDFRYSINPKKISSSLGWEPKYKFNDALEITIDWYLSNLDWCKKMIEKSGYSHERLGIDD